MPGMYLGVTSVGKQESLTTLQVYSFTSSLVHSNHIVNNGQNAMTIRELVGPVENKAFMNKNLPVSQ